MSGTLCLGRYCKFARNLSQSPWGRPGEDDHSNGSSVEDIISKRLRELVDAQGESIRLSTAKMFFLQCGES